ncbi:MAG TPA: bZIP transcription factor, partial [Fibrella sp.]
GVNGDNNLAIGFEAGKSNQSGMNNTFIGFRADAGGSSLNNATAIGNNAKVNVSNALVLGSGANVGIGTSSPSSRLHISTGTNGQSGLRLENLTIGSAASATNQTKFLTVDANGNVVLGSLNSSAREAAQSAQWSQQGEDLFNVNGGAVVIGKGVSKMPADYNLFVSKGILTEKVKVAIRNTSEWSDKVFAPQYKLRTLSEVEKFIKSQGHLPGVPSAEQVVNEGIDVGGMDAKLLEKVEELTLYVIELKKQNESLQRQINKVERNRKPVRRSPLLTK